MSLVLVSAWPAPDHPSWRNLPGYSPELARILSYAMALDATQAPANCNLAATLVYPYVSRVVIAPQRLRVCYIVASYMALDYEYDDALTWLDEALELAIELDDDNARLDILTLRSGLHRALLHIGKAAADTRTGLTLLERRVFESFAEQAGRKLRLTAHLAGFEYYLGHYAVAETLLADARALAPDAPDASLDTATVDWVQTHLHRLRGRPEEALRIALATATTYTEANSPISAARAQALAAEVAMDIAARLPAYADRSAMLRIAWHHLHIATCLTQKAQDPVGRLMVRLTRIRFGRLRRNNENRIALIEQVIRKARRLGDIAVVAEAFTALGDELAANGESESALTCYRQTLEILHGSDFPAVGIQAQRALRVAGEWDCA